MSGRWRFCRWPTSRVTRRRNILRMEMTEAVIANLAKIKAMKVISRTSVMPYKNSKKSIREIAREVHADAVIEGSVMRSADRVRITVELIDPSADQHLWAESYERDLKNVLTFQ